ncbi:alcohol dehydrogenase catalytic domain-containing protein [Pseudoroseomonas wenyumeiae]
METGSGVTDLAAGDHVVMSFLPVCGHCPSCSDGRASSASRDTPPMRPAPCSPASAASSATVQRSITTAVYPPSLSIR